MPTDSVKVWDLFVRLFHWSLVVAFFVAYFTEPEDSGIAVHVWAGYFIGGLLVLRVVWGFVGSPHARFSDFAFGPFKALRYVADLARGKSRRHLGHSPTGAWMVYLLITALGATVLTGMITLAVDKHAGPLAPLFDGGATSSAAVGGSSSNAPKNHEDVSRPDRGESRADALEEAHEVLANIVLILVILHLLGVVAASFAHHENLVRSMVTGYKRSNER